MFERFTERARKVMVLAQDEAERFGHDYIGTEHILLGLVGESEGVAVRVLSNLDPDRVRREVLRRLGQEPGTDQPDEGDRILFRGRIASLRVEARVGGGTQEMLVDLAYEAYDEEISEAMDHSRLLEQVTEALEGRMASGLPVSRTFRR